MLGIIYRRVSTEEQEKSGYSLPEQLHRCIRTLAEAAGVDPNTISVSDQPGPGVQVLDIAESAPGDAPYRPGLQALLSAVQQYRPQYVVCLHPDRLSRDLYIQLDVHRQIERSGAKLLFAEVKFEDSPEGILYRQLLGALSEWAKRRILATTERGKMGKLRRGQLPYRVAPYGYRWDSERDLPVPDALDGTGRPIPGTPAAVVWQIFEWAAQGVGCRTIAARLNGEVPGYAPAPPPGTNNNGKGTKWYSRTIACIISNPVYRGEAVVHKTDQRGVRQRAYLPPEERKKRPSRLHRPPEEWFSIPVPAIIPESLWNEAQRAREEARRRRDGRAKYPYLVSGLAICGVCGQPMTGYGAGGGHYKVPTRRHYYMCVGRQPRERGPRREVIKCTAPVQRADGPDGVDALVWQQVRDWLVDPEVRRRAAERARSERREGPDPRALEEAAARIMAEHARLLQAYRAGVVVDEEETLAELGRLKREADRLRRQAEQLRATQETSVDVDALAERYLQLIELADEDPEARREVVRALVTRVVLRPGEAPQIEFVG